jgi:hypothetical protein
VTPARPGGTELYYNSNDSIFEGLGEKEQSKKEREREKGKKGFDTKGRRRIIFTLFCLGS